MAFTTTQKLTIVRLLGWPANSINPESILYNNILNSRLLVIMTEAEAEALALVERVTSLDAKLETALDRAGVRRIDDIELTGTEMSTLRNERNKVIRELSSLLDVPMMNAGGAMGNICL